MALLDAIIDAVANTSSSSLRDVAAKVPLSASSASPSSLLCLFRELKAL
jgi:hypothetical protein